MTKITRRSILGGLAVIAAPSVASAATPEPETLEDRRARLMKELHEVLVEQTGKPWKLVDSPHEHGVVMLIEDKSGVDLTTSEAGYEVSWRLHKERV